MPGLIGRFLGIPISAEDNDQAFRNVVGDRKAQEAVALILSGVMHNTEKAGALLAAQGIFVVAGIFTLDHGWPRLPVVAAMLLLLVGAMLAMSMLRSTAGVFLDHPTKTDPLRRMYDLMRWRMLRFNIALYLTFLSITLLGVAAVVFAL